MGTASDDIVLALGAYKRALSAYTAARQSRDNAQRQVSDIETEVYYEAMNDGKLDGKNAESRDAQAKFAYRSEPRWQTAVDTLRRAEDTLATATAERDAAYVELKVRAMLLNVEIAEQGSAKLLGEISLAGVSSSV